MITRKHKICDTVYPYIQPINVISNKLYIKFRCNYRLSNNHILIGKRTYYEY